MTPEARRDAPSAGPLPDPTAWPSASADLAAHRRWRSRAPGIVRATLQAPSEAEVVATADDLERAHAADGIGRVDLAIGSIGPTASEALVRQGWMVGSTGDQIVASRLVQPRWRPVRANVPALVQRGGLPATRVWRHLRGALDVAPVERGRVIADELAARIRYRSAFRGAPAEPSEPTSPGDPHPFAPTRFRTIASALEVVPPALRRTAILDAGCGDGRVLLEARRGRFAAGIGWEIDPSLAATAERRLRGWATITRSDITTSAIPDEVGVVFANNPFDREPTSRFAERISARAREGSPPLLVVFVNLRWIEPLLDAGLVLVDATFDLCAFASPDRAATASSN